MGKTTSPGERSSVAPIRASGMMPLPPERRRNAVSRRPSPAEAGFTLAGVLVILTIVMVFVAYTVPKQWSLVMQRERELQTIYVMRQYARACFEFQRKHNVWPSSIDQLKEARLPRFIRGGPKSEFVDPLTGQVDWLVIPASAAQAGVNNGTLGTTTPGGAVIGVAPGTGPAPTTGTTGSSGTSGTPGTTGTDTTGTGTGTPAAPGIPIKDYAGGPFVGVRPPKTGESILEFRGAKSYEQWSYTAIDMQLEVQNYIQGIQNSLQWK